VRWFNSCLKSCKQRCTHTHTYTCVHTHTQHSPAAEAGAASKATAAAMGMGAPSSSELTLRDLVQRFAEEYSVQFMPKFGRFQDGQQVRGLLFSVIDTLWLLLLIVVASIFLQISVV